MFVCRIVPIAHRKNNRVLQEANQIIEKHRKKCAGSRPYILSAKLKTKVKFFIDDFHYHLDNKSLPNRVERYRLIPCVFELLKFTEEWPPRKGTGENCYMLTGQTPDGKCFEVIIRKEAENFVLQSLYPTKTISNT
jgi:hypothetical protein